MATATPPLFRAPEPGTSIALPHPPVLTAPVTADAAPASATPLITRGAQHTATPARTIITRRRIGLPHSRHGAESQPRLSRAKTEAHVNRPGAARSTPQLPFGVGVRSATGGASVPHNSHSMFI